MNYAATRERLQEYRAKIAELRQEMRATQGAVEPEPVRDYVFSTPVGDVRLSQLNGRPSFSFPETLLAYSANSLPIVVGGFR